MPAKAKTKSMRKTYVDFLSLPAREKFKMICDVLDFYIAGEERNKQILYFLLLGNYSQHHKTMVIYRGDSSAGKSYVVDSVIKLFPIEDFYWFDSATAKALEYDEELQEKTTIYLKEMREEYHDSVINFLMSIFDEGDRVHKETVKDNETQSFKVISHEKQRKGVITTLSFENLRIDIINRSWILTPDQKHEQTKRIIDFTIDSYKYKIDRTIKEKQVLNKAYLIGQSTKVLEWDYIVFIPYIEKLRSLFLYQFLNIRRDINKLTHLIEIITIWNQFNRRFVKIGMERYLFSEYEDLELALEIAHDLFIDLILHIDDTKKLILNCFKDIIEINKPTITQKSIGSFIEDVIESDSQEVKEETTVNKLTITEVTETLKEHLGISRRTVARRMEDLFYEGYLYREKIKAKFYYSKIKGYNIIEALKLKDMKEEIDDLVNLKYGFYKDASEELLGGIYSAMERKKKA